MSYQHGGDIYSQRIRWDFSVNLNPLGMPKDVQEAVKSSTDFCSQYPDSRCGKLTEKLSRYHQVPEEDILCGNGAADLIFQIVYAERPREGWILAPSFSEYEKALMAVFARARFFFLRREEDFLLDPHRLMDTLEREGVGEGAVLFLCNPNNPTGQLLERGEVEAIAAFAEEKKIRLVMDECFLDFTEMGESSGRYSLLPGLERFPHAAVLRAFTKSYAMAGLRLGYCISKDHSFLEQMACCRQPWPVSVPAQMAGEAALDQEEYRRESVRVIQEGREQLRRGLKKLGFWVCKSQANFLLFQDLRPEGREGRLFSLCRDRGLLLRHCDNFHGLDGSYYRVCVKTKEENTILLSMLEGLQEI